MLCGSQFCSLLMGPNSLLGIGMGMFSKLSEHPPPLPHIYFYVDDPQVATMQAVDNLRQVMVTPPN